MKKFAVILAGGGGTRFWPLSRQDLPKQFLNLTGDDLLVNETIARLQPTIAPQDVYVVTNIAQAGMMRKATAGMIAPTQIMAEPAARGTAACIGYAALELQRQHGDVVMCVFAADHYIKDVGGFNQTLCKAIALAEETDSLVTIGVRPTFPAVGYGYIKYDVMETDRDFHEVNEFVEKPDVMTARRYLAEGGHLWNSGMFVWKTSAILRNFAELLPDIYEILLTIEADNISEVYPTIPKISVDYGIMERAKKVIVVESRFDWSDVGSFDALEALYEKDENGNIVNRKQIMIDTKNCIVYAKGKLIATLGVEDLIIVEADDAIMVCHKDKAQSVRDIPDELKKQGREEYL
ncbi:MAG: mannose-1-phosphate guanylyltransferase [Lachnospiraceae bacterium]|jgi:mannose-1-phosphate guanylyltransferase|nr:mannose-1-phosphate guanylyltransferase [Lachnospiraceae bacterium]